MVFPNPGMEPTERTELRIVFDNANLYNPMEAAALEGIGGVKQGQARESAQRTLENMLKMLKSEVQTVRILPAAEFERQKNVRPDSGQAAISDR